ncbi:hypothetical protein [Gaetbulibacter aestuarii]|uniref:hypothetical protein n=1 Tax=Gaetbulibacter aestuarii TaxID=1502358 RepID=UPI0031DF0D8B
MGRKSKQELQENQPLDKKEIIECLKESQIDLNKINTDEFAMNIYQFTKLFYDNIK